MSDTDRAYFEQRADAEAERAQAAADPAAMRVHCQLAEAYLDKLAGGDMSQPRAMQLAAAA